MEENLDALDVIARTRGKVQMDESPTGDSLFLVWGWPAAVFFLLDILFEAASNIYAKRIRRFLLR